MIDAAAPPISPSERGQVRRPQLRGTQTMARTLWRQRSAARVWPGFAAAAAVLVALAAGSKFGVEPAIGLFALALGLSALSSPVFATIVLLVAMFMRLPLNQIPFPVDPFLIAFAVLVIATVIWIDRTPIRLRGLGTVGWAMLLYLTWVVYSMLVPHEYPAGPQIPNPELTNLPLTPLSVPRFILTAVAIPFGLYVVGRFVFDRASAVRALLWTILAFASYSATVSILQFTGPKELVWPRYIVDDPGWTQRAVGIFNQPVVNGMVLALGFTIAMLLVHRREPVWRRALALVIAAACGYALFLTYTRAAWLSGAVALVIGAILAKGSRKGFIVAICGVAAVIGTNWSTFTSDDREAGGVGSTGEVEDRLNTIQTALWGAREHPVTGWGIGRFEALNTYHHQQWSPDSPWIRGYGIVSHGNEFAILAELGVVGLVLWILVLGLALHRLSKAYRALPDDELCGKPLIVAAITALAILICTGLTVDLRYFDFPTATVFLIVGVAIGWADRSKPVPTDTAHEDADRTLVRHA